jgi:hypothetical protein
MPKKVSRRAAELAEEEKTRKDRRAVIHSIAAIIMN